MVSIYGVVARILREFDATGRGSEQPGPLSRPGGRWREDGMTDREPTAAENEALRARRQRAEADTLHGGDARNRALAGGRVVCIAGRRTGSIPVEGDGELNKSDMVSWVASRASLSKGEAAAGVDGVFEAIQNALARSRPHRVRHVLGKEPASAYWAELEDGREHRDRRLDGAFLQDGQDPARCGALAFSERDSRGLAAFDGTVGVVRWC